METITCVIKREKSFVAALMPYEVSIDGMKMGKISNGRELVIEIPNKRCTINFNMVGNSFAFHKNEKSAVLFPEYCKSGKIRCFVQSKMNWIGYLSLGLIQSVTRIEVTVEYI